MDSHPLFEAFNILITAAAPTVQSRALKTAISILVGDTQASAEQPCPPRGNTARLLETNHRTQHQATAGPEDWEPLRLKLRSVVAGAAPAQRVQIAAELGVAPSSLRNFISNATPGQAVAARVQQWLEHRRRHTAQLFETNNLTQEPAGGTSIAEPPPGANGRAAALNGLAARSNRQIARTLNVHHDTIDRDIGGNPPRVREGSNKTNGERSAGGGNPPPLTGEQAAGRLPVELRARLAFLVEHDAAELRRSAHVSAEVAHEAASGAELAGEIIGRLTQFLAG